MTNKETTERNIGLTFDFLRQVLYNPSIIDKIPDNGIIEFVQKDIPIKEKIAEKRPDKYIRVKRDFELL
jgi:hypothetical protein